MKSHRHSPILSHCLLFLLVLLLAGSTTFAQSSSFTYQGRLQDGGTAANGNYDFQFTLWDAVSGGTQQPQPGPVTVARTSVQVANGVFTTQLDFGANAFSGTDRYLEIGVRLAGGGAFTVLSPRQQITGTPYAIRSSSADSADTATTATNATQLGGVAASQYVLTSDSRLSNSRPPTAGSSNYIQNTLGQQAGSNFNISGTGTANVFDAATQYNIGGTRVLGIAGQNTFAGVNAGGNTTGLDNSFFGGSAGLSNTTGGSNSFVGASAGRSNTTGLNNSFFGESAGLNNTTGGTNSFFGVSAGYNNITGGNNSFFGVSAGLNNTSGGTNSFFGVSAGYNNTTELSGIAQMLP